MDASDLYIVDTDVASILTDMTMIMQLYKSMIPLTQHTAFRNESGKGWEQVGGQQFGRVHEFPLTRWNATRSHHNTDCDGDSVQMHCIYDFHSNSSERRVLLEHTSMLRQHMWRNM